LNPLKKSAGSGYVIQLYGSADPDPCQTYILLDPDLREPVRNLELPVLLHEVEAVPGQRVEVAVRHPVQALWYTSQGSDNVSVGFTTLISDRDEILAHNQPVLRIQDVYPGSEVFHPGSGSA
jgi:hypothetical protein